MNCTFNVFAEIQRISDPNIRKIFEFEFQSRILKDETTNKRKKEKVKMKNEKENKKEEIKMKICNKKM